MLLYLDIFSGDEMLSDAFNPVLVDDIVYEADCKMIPVGGENIDIGANPSTEEGEETLDDTVEMVNNIVYTFRLQPTSFDKKGYTSYIRGYMKRLREHLQSTNPERVPVFEKAATNFVKKVLANFKDYEFYTGESFDTDAMVALLNYREDGVTPYFTFFKDGLREQKL